MKKIFYATMCILILGCESFDKKGKAAETKVEASFEVNKSLLAENRLYSSDSLISFYPPLDWVKNDSLINSEGVIGTYIDKSDSSILIYSEVDPLADSLYRVGLQNNSQPLNISESEFTYNSLEIRQFVTQYPDIVAFKVFIFDDRSKINRVYSIDYFIKASLIQDKVKSIESSIGSVEPKY